MKYQAKLLVKLFREESRIGWIRFEVDFESQHTIEVDTEFHTGIFGQAPVVESKGWIQSNDTMILILADACFNVTDPSSLIASMHRLGWIVDDGQVDGECVFSNGQIDFPASYGD